MITLLCVQFSLAQGEKCVYFFYGENCATCEDVSAHLSDLQNQNPNWQIERFESYLNTENTNLLEGFFDAYDVPEKSRGVPAVFVTDSYYIGNTTLSPIFETHLQEKNESLCPTLEPGNVVGLVGKKQPYRVLETVSAGRITGPALKDSVGVSMIALMLLFMVILGAKRDKDKLIRRAFLFIAVVFAVNLMFALGLFGNIGATQFPFFFTKVIGIVAIVYGCLWIYAFWKRYKTKLLDEISKPTKERVVQKAKFWLSSPGVIILGFIGGIISLNNRSEAFEIMQILYNRYDLHLAILPLFIYYIFLLIIPLLILTYIFHRIKRQLEARSEIKGEGITKKVQIWNNHHHRVLNFCVHALIVIVGIILVLV